MSSRLRLAIPFLVLSAVLGPGPAEAARGGPDAGGWRWADSAEPGVGTGIGSITSSTNFTFGWADEEVIAVPLSFPFTLYGTTSATVWVSSNGWISLTDPAGNASPVNQPIPRAGAPDAMLALWWDDLWGGTSSFGVHGPTASGHRIDVRLEDKATGDLMQYFVEFRRNGSIKVLFSLVPGSSSATVGIENAAGGAGTELAFNAARAPGVALANDYALLYHPDSAPSCATATPLACGGSVSGTTTGGANQAVSYGCSTRAYTGNEAVHRVDLAASSAFTATLTGAVGGDIMLLRGGCDGYLECVAGGARSLNVPLLAAGTYYLVVDALTPGQNGNYNLSTTCSAVASPIACGQTVTATPTGSSGIDQYSCTWGTLDGPERIYDFTLAAPTTISASLASATPYDVFLVRASDLTPGTTTCLRMGDQDFGVINLPAGNYSLVVDRIAAASGSFSLRLDCPAQVPATAIACNQFSVPSSNAGPSFVDDYSSCGANGYGQGEAWYRFQPSQRVIATFTPDNTIDYDLFAFREADATSRCLGTSTDSLTLVNVDPSSYLISLDSAWIEGPTGLSVTCQPFNPTPLTCNTTVSGATAAVAGVMDNYSCLFRSLDGSEAWFLLDNPVAQTFAVGVDSTTPGQDVDIAVFDAQPLDPLSPICLAGGLNSATVTDAPAGSYLVVVDGYNGAVATSFQLTTACGPSTLGCATAPPLACNSLVSGDTASGPTTAYTYGAVDGLFTGPELVYHFVNPVKQNVNFLLRNASDPRLDLFLLRGCDATQLVDWGDDALIEPGLDPGDYYLVVDGREGAAGTFELVSFCGGPVLDPAVLRSTLQAGQCVTERKKLYFPTSVPAADVVFSFDLSGSMGEELNQAKNNARAIYTELNRLVPSLQFGLASFVEYASCYTDTVCGVSGFCPPAAGAFPFRMNQPLTTDIAQVDAVLQSIVLIGGAKETYTRTFHEAATNPVVGWRTCSRRLWLNFGDEVPVDCNVYSCIGGNWNTGRDPGPDLVTGTADDLELIPVIDRMASNNIALIHVDSSEDPNQIANWDCLARRTGGTAFVTDSMGRIPGGTDIVRGLVDVIKETLRPCPDVRLVPTGPQASWVTILPASYSNIVTPFYGEFDVQFCVPAGTAPGVYSVPVEARCIGAGSCSSELLGSQAVELTVSDPCVPGPAAIPGAAPDVVCEGAAVVLDGAGSTACNASGLEYRWLLGAVEVCPWSTTPICPVTPTASASYTLEVRCLGTGATCQSSASLPITVVPYPVPALSPLPDVCAGATVVLDASASNGSCPEPLEYQFREGAVVLQPWSTNPTFGPLAPAASTRYTVDVRCTALPGCLLSASADLNVVPLPIAAAGSDVNVCAPDPVTLDGSGSTAAGCPGGALYEWRNGATVVRPASPSPTWTPPTAAPGTTTYTLHVSCAALPACAATDPVVVIVRDCPLAVRWGSYSAEYVDDGTPGTVRVSWTTLDEKDTLGFRVERADSASGPFAAVGDALEARGGLSRYELRDAPQPGNGSPWYRVVEITTAGESGDATPPFAAQRAGGEPSAGGGRRGRTRARGR